MSKEDGKVVTKDTVAIVDGRLHINAGVGKGVPSSTGKSTVHVSTGGFVDIEGSGYKYSLLVIKKA